MSELQQEAVRMISKLSDDNVSFLIEIIHRLMPRSEKSNDAVTSLSKDDRAIEAFRRLDIARNEIRQYFPDDFEPEKELEKARAGLSSVRKGNYKMCSEGAMEYEGL